MALIKSIIFSFLFSCSIATSFAQQTVDSQSLYWFSSGKNIRKANQWLTAIETANNSDFVSNKDKIEEIRAALSKKNTIDNTLKDKTDKQITKLVLNFLKVLQEGKPNFDYDEVSVSRDSFYINQLFNSGRRESVSKTVARLECKDKEYTVLKNFLHDSITVKDTLKYKTVLLAMNYLKYLTVNHQSEYILVNIAAAEARYYKNDLLSIKMRIVAGKQKTPTPTIASYITSIVTFPYWNVPNSIAVKEILPKVQKDENYLEQNNFDVIDAKGNEIEDSELKWKDYNENNFPYYFRQSTGAGNSLGVLKFYMKNPFSIFLHATSWQGVFAKDYRFLSHGCIRLEKPFELAGALLRDNIDIEKLKTGKKNTESNILVLPHKIPTFIIYMPITIVGNKVTFLKDVYGLVN